MCQWAAQSTSDKSNLNWFRRGCECETHGQVAPLRAVLEDPKAPVLVKVRDLIFQVVVRPEAIFDTHTHIFRTEVDNVLRERFDGLGLEQGVHTSRIHLA